MAKDRVFQIIEALSIGVGFDKGFDGSAALFRRVSILKGSAYIRSGRTCRDAGR